MMDINSLRNETPGSAEVIHFNNAGASLVSNKVLNAQLNYIKEESIYGSYETQAKRAEDLNTFYNEVAKLIGADADEIAYTESSTVAWLRAFFALEFKLGDEVICDSFSYASNYIAFLNAKDRFGIEIKIIDQVETGEIDLNELEKAISPKAKLISITHIPTNNGIVNPAEEVGAIAKKHNIIYQLDACQSVGQYPIDVNKIQCDFLSATGRKYMRGPRGTGFLYVRKELISKINPLSLDLHSAEWLSNETFKARNDAKKFETWESNRAAKYAMAVATNEINSLGIKAIWERVQFISNHLRQKLTSIPSIEVTDIGKIKSGIVTFRSSIKSTSEIKEHLSNHKINTVVAVKNGTLIDMSKRNIDSVVRASLHYYNTEEEIDKFVACLSKFIA